MPRSGVPDMDHGTVNALASVLLAGLGAGFLLIVGVTTRALDKQRANLEREKQAFERHKDVVDAVCEESDRLRAENCRLRAAIKLNDVHEAVVEQLNLRDVPAACAPAVVTAEVHEQAATNVDGRWAWVPAIGLGGAEAGDRAAESPACTSPARLWAAIAMPQREGGEMVFRFPADLERRVLVAFEGPQDMFLSGWLVDAGNVVGSPPVVLHPPSAKAGS